MMEWDQHAHETIMRDRTTATAEQIAEWHHPGKVLTVEESLHHGFIHEVRQFVRPKNFHHDAATKASFGCEKDLRHSPAGELTIDRVRITEGCPKPVEKSVGHYGGLQTKYHECGA